MDQRDVRKKLHDLSEYGLSLAHGTPRQREYSPAKTRITRKIFQIVETHFGQFLTRYHTVTALCETFNQTVVMTNNDKSQVE